jgi:hypothetical protein
MTVQRSLDERHFIFLSAPITSCSSHNVTDDSTEHPGGVIERGHNAGGRPRALATWPALENDKDIVSGAYTLSSIACWNL